MTNPTLLNDLDLAALMCSRVCHDVISPVGAIANGLEVLDDEDDEKMREVALDLVRRSARQASAKLQFCRLAFGAAGSAGAHLDLKEAEAVTRGFLGQDKIKLEWSAPAETRPKAQVKLLLNLVLMGMSAIPRGGKVAVMLAGDRLSARASGEGARVPEKSASLLNGRAKADELDARLVQVYYARRLAEEAGYRLAIGTDGADVVISATPVAAAVA